MRTFLEDFFSGTERATYPKELQRTPGSIAGKLGVTILVVDVNSDDVHLVRIRTPKQFVGGGFGGKALRFLCGLADRHGLSICLCPLPNAHAKMDKEALVAWYHRRGFRQGNKFMVRVPKRSSVKTYL